MTPIPFLAPVLFLWLVFCAVNRRLTPTSSRLGQEYGTFGLSQILLDLGLPY